MFMLVLIFYVIASLIVGGLFVWEINIEDFNYKEMKLWHLIISIIFFIGSILGILIGYLIIKIINTFKKTNIYKTLNRKPFRR